MGADAPKFGIAKAGPLHNKFSERIEIRDSVR